MGAVILCPSLGQKVFSSQKPSHLKRGFLLEKQCLGLIKKNVVFTATLGDKHIGNRSEPLNISGKKNIGKNGMLLSVLGGKHIGKTPKSLIELIGRHIRNK